MKEKFEALLSNNKTRTVLTVIVTAIIVTACIGLGSALASPKSDDNSATDKRNTVAVQPVSVPTPDAVATAGAVKDSDSADTAEKQDSDKSGSNDFIGESKAKSIALAKAGGGKVAYCYLDYDDGIAEYEVKILWGNDEYEIEINAKTGKITDFDKDRIEYDDDHDDYDDNDHNDHYDD